MSRPLAAFRSRIMKSSALAFFVTLALLAVPAVAHENGHHWERHSHDHQGHWKHRGPGYRYDQPMVIYRPYYAPPPAVVYQPAYYGYRTEPVITIGVGLPPIVIPLR